MSDEGIRWPAGSVMLPVPTGPRELDTPTVVYTPLDLLASEREARTFRQDELEELAGDIAEDFQRERERRMEDAFAPVPTEDPSYTGVVIDNRYVVESLLAKGGMGVVYQCRHKIIGKKLAVKIIRADVALLPEAPQRFLLEAKAASAIGNEHIIDISDFGTLPDGSAYLVMELLEGIALSDLVRQHQRLPMPRILAIATQVAEGLCAAHRAGIVHRDLKPENIFLLRRKSEDFVKILDFGIAKMPRLDGGHLTRTGAVVGTPHYMSPEQAAGAPIDQRGDIYALGVILYELATGRVPFDGAHHMAVLIKHVSEPPPPFNAVTGGHDLPPEFEAVVLRCLAKRPEDRYASMTELIQALQGLTQREASAKLRSAAVPPKAGRSVKPLAAASVPAAPSRRVSATPKSRGRGLYLFGALFLLAFIGSVWRLQGAEQDTGPSAAAFSATNVAELEPVDATPTAPTTPPAPAPITPGGAPPVAPTPVATSAPVSPPPEDLEAPATIVELVQGKTVEIETRTRLSLRLKSEADAPIGVAPRSEPPRPNRRASAKRSAHPAPEKPAPEAPPNDDLMQPWSTQH